MEIMRNQLVKTALNAVESILQGQETVTNKNFLRGWAKSTITELSYLVDNEEIQWAASKRD